MQEIESLFYESQPYLYSIIAMVGLSYAKESTVALVASLVLGICGLTIMQKRNTYRKTFANGPRRAS